MHLPTSYSSAALATIQRLLPDLAALAVEQEEYFTISTYSHQGLNCGFHQLGRS
jgi:hypothetical protein